jgi:hypothetical protein
MQPDEDNRILTMRVSTDAGSTWKTSGYEYTRTVHWSGGSGSGNSTSSGDIVLQEAIELDSAAFCYAEVRIFDPAQSDRQKLIHARCHAMGNGTSVRGEIVDAFYGSTTSAIDGIRFLMSSGDIKAGVFKLQGRTRL